MEKKRIKKQIWVGSVVMTKVGEMEENTREGRIRRMRKEVVGRVQVVVEKKKVLVQFEDGKKKETRSCSVLCLCSKEEVEMDEPISNSPKKRTSRIVDY